MGYMTPTSIPETTECFLVQIPSDANLIAAFFGAILDLTLAYNWEQSEGGLTPQETINFTVGWYQQIAEDMCMGICDDIVAGCLTNPNFIEEIVDGLLPTGIGAGGGGSNTPIDAIGQYDISGLGSACTDEERYGVCFSIVNQLNILARDLFQAVELGTNAIEQASTLLNAIPVFGGLLSAIVETVDWIIEFMDEAYNANFTLTTHEEVACAIYCEMGDCSLTIDDIRQALRNILSTYDPPLENVIFVDFISWMTPLVVSLTPLHVVAMVHLFVVEVLVRGSSFIGSDYRVLEIAGALSSSLAPPEGCDCPNTWIYEWDFEVNNGQSDGWLPTATGGAYTASVGYTATKPSASYNTYLGMVDVGMDITLTRIDFEAIATNLNTTNNAKIRAWQNVDFTSPNVVLVNSNSTGTPIVYQWVGDEVGIQSILCSVLGANGDGAIGNIIKKITLYGRGEKPAWTQGTEL